MPLLKFKNPRLIYELAEIIEEIAENAVASLRRRPDGSLVDPAEKSDRHALKIMEGIGKINAIGFADINNLYDPELITVGGAIALNNWEFIKTPY